jgi:hypothetical protein
MFLRRLGRLLLFLFASIGVAYVGLMLFFKLYADPTSCLWATAMVVASPSESYFAKVQTKSCAHEPMQTIVSLQKDRDEHVGSTSYRVFEGAASDQNANGGYSIVPISLNWLSDHEILIVHPKGIGENTSDRLVDGIKVTFREALRVRSKLIQHP